MILMSLRDSRGDDLATAIVRKLVPATHMCVANYHEKARYCAERCLDSRVTLWFWINVLNEMKLNK